MLGTVNPLSSLPPLPLITLTQLLPHNLLDPGSKASSHAFATAVKLAQKLLGVFTSATHVECVQMGQEPDGFLENILQDGTFSKIEDHAEWYNDLFTGYSQEEPSPVDKSFSVSHDSYSRSYFHPGIFLKSPTWTPITTTINTLASKSTGSTGVEGLDSCDTKYLNGELVDAQTPSIRSRSDSEDSSVDMFYDYSNSSDDGASLSCHVMSCPYITHHRYLPSIDLIPMTSVFPNNCCSFFLQLFTCRVRVQHHTTLEESHSKEQVAS